MKNHLVIKDRFTLGFLAGVAGWFPQMIFTQTMFWGFNLLNMRYQDFAGVIAFNNKPQSVFQIVFTEFLIIGLMGVLGGTFALMIKVEKDKNVIMKGVLFSISFWALVYSITVMFKITGIEKGIDFKTSVLNVVASVIYGAFMGAAYLYLYKKYYEPNS